MKAISVRTTLAAILFALASIATAHAQHTAVIATVNVPFAFDYGNHQFPAGKYTISQITEQVVQINNHSVSGMAMMLPAMSKRDASGSKILFHKVGSRYFLYQIWPTGNKQYLTSWVSKTEKQAIQMQLAATRVSPENVELALLEPR